jgi:predicted ABC-type sugar transport system permease subunit
MRVLQTTLPSLPPFRLARASLSRAAGIAFIVLSLATTANGGRVLYAECVAACLATLSPYCALVCLPAMLAQDPE